MPTRIPPGPALSVFAGAAWALLAAGPAAAQTMPEPPPGAVLVDGLAILAGGSSAAEDEAAPVTVSRLGLEADLLLVRRHGPEWTRFAADPTLRRQARRVAALVRLLARQARQMGETVAAEDRDAVLAWIEERAGGSAALEALLARRGATREDLATWAEEALLAEAQTDFIADRSGREADRDDAEPERAPSGGPPGERGAARREARALRTREALADWLAAALERTLLRLLP